MKQIVLFFVFAAAAALFFGLWRAAENKAERAEANFYASVDSLHTYRVRDSLHAASAATLRLRVAEFEALRAADAELIRAMGLRLRRVESVAKISTHSDYVLRPTGDTAWAVRTPYLDFSARKRADTLEARFAVRDTLVQVLHRVPRFTFLGIWFGTKGVRQEVVSKNPHTQIVAAEYIEIMR